MKVARIGRGAHAEEAYALAAEGRLHIREHRGRDERDLLPLALDDEGQGLARMGADDLLAARRSPNRLSVDLEHEVSRKEARRGGGARGLDALDARGERLLAVKIGRRREDRDRQDEICRGPGRHDQSARPHRLGRQALAPHFGRHFRERGFVRQAGRVLIAIEFDVAAERHGGDAPTGALSIVEAEELRAEAERERPDADAAPAARR